jgi:hypothetical protein
MPKIPIEYRHQWTRDNALATIYRRAFQIMQHGTKFQKLRTRMIINSYDQFQFMTTEEIELVAADIHDLFYDVLDDHPEILRGGIRTEEK